MNPHRDGSGRMSEENITGVLSESRQDCMEHRSGQDFQAGYHTARLIYPNG